MYHRYKPYRRYRNEIQDVYNPSLKNANVPNYYQRKGRTIQQTPLKMRNSPTKTITRKELEKMYKTLILYKFPIPNNERVPVYLTIIGKIKDLFAGDPLKFTGDDLWTHANDLMQKKYSMLLASGDWHYECIGIQFLNNSSDGIDYGKRYIIYWYTDILPNGYAPIMTKSNDDAIPANASTLITSAVPETENLISVLEIRTSSSSKYSYYENTYNNGDPSPHGKALYPFLDSRLIPSETLYGEFRYSSSGENISDQTMTLFVIAIPD